MKDIIYKAHDTRTMKDINLPPERDYDQDQLAKASDLIGSLNPTKVEIGAIYSKGKKLKDVIAFRGKPWNSTLEFLGYIPLREEGDFIESKITHAKSPYLGDHPGLALGDIEYFCFSGPIEIIGYVGNKRLPFNQLLKR